MRFLSILYFVATLTVCGLTAAPALGQEPVPPQPAPPRPAPPQPAPPPPPQGSTTANDWLTREKLLGDWGGARTELGNKGVRLGADFTQFFEWAPEGDDDRGFDYGGHLDFRLVSDLTNYVAKGLSVTSHVEFRYGDTPLLAGGTLVPTSAAMLFPEAEGEHIDLSSLYGSYLFSPNFVLNFGRFDMVDLYVKPFTGGEGLDKFMNMAFVAPPMWARTIPPVTEGVIGAFLKNSEPLVTLGLIGSTEDGFFDNGATVMWDVRLPFHPFDLPGQYSVGGEFSSITATSLDQTKLALLPPLNIPLAEEEGAWTLNVTAHQYLTYDEGTKRGWGTFGMFGVTDGNPNFVDVFAHAGFAGNVPLRGRERDTFGLGYYYSGVSDDLQNTLEPLIRMRKEQGFEIFYSFAATGWSKLTADLQFVDPFLLGSETRLFFSVRWKIEI
jgi:porin